MAWGHDRQLILLSELRGEAEGEVVSMRLLHG